MVNIMKLLYIPLVYKFISACKCRVAIFLLYVTVFLKTDLMVTSIEIHFLAVDESNTHALSRDIMRLDGQVCFYRRLFCDVVKPRGCISWPMWPVMIINKIA